MCLAATPSPGPTKGPWCELEPPEGQLLGGDTVQTAGDPRGGPNYIENARRYVAIPIWGGPFYLSDKPSLPAFDPDAIVLPRSEVHLDDDPLKGFEIAITRVYRSKAAADTVVSAFAYEGAYTFYLGAGRYIYPTIISNTTAPRLCAALRVAVDGERENARAAEKLSKDLLLWYVGARLPTKVSGGASVAATGAAKASGGVRLVFIEIGAGDLKASIELAKKGVKVMAVDPVVPAVSAVKELEAAGGTFIRGGADSLPAASADHVFQYFPWRIGGTGRSVGGGTWRLIDDAMKLLRPDGAAHFVTEDYETAEFLAKEAASKGLRVALTDSSAGAAASGASGAAVPSFSKALKVWLVNIYK